MTRSSSGLAAGVQSAPVLTFHPGTEPFLIVSGLFGKEGEEARGLGTGLRPNGQRPGTAPENRRRHSKLPSLLSSLLCPDERVWSTGEAAGEFGKPCSSRAWRSDPHLLNELLLLKQCKGPS